MEEYPEGHWNRELSISIKRVSTGSFSCMVVLTVVLLMWLNCGIWTMSIGITETVSSSNTALILLDQTPQVCFG